MLRDETDEETYAVIGAAMGVHNALGCGFLEAVYQEALAIELTHRGIPFEKEVDLPIHFRGQKLACSYRADFVCFGCIIVEVKSIQIIGRIEEAQVINYLKATNLQRALLLNFGNTKLNHKRMINSTRHENLVLDG